MGCYWFEDFFLFFNEDDLAEQAELRSAPEFIRKRQN